MEDLEIEEEELLNLSLSLASHGEGGEHRNTRRKKNSNHDSSTSRDSSDGGDHHCDDHQVEILGLLQQREQMLRGVNRAEEEDSRRRKQQRLDPHMIHRIMASIDEYSLSSAVADLTKMYQSASLTGDSAQRAAAYFADGLTAKLLIKENKPSFYDMVMKEPTPGQEFLAFTHLYKVSPCYQFSHFTANQAILEAFEREQGGSGLLVLDFDLAYGFQWPSLMQSLSEKASATSTTISLRIAGFGRCSEELAETEARLVSFSKGFGNVVFEFQGLLRRRGPSSSIQIDSTVSRRQNETLAVNLVSCLQHHRTSNTFLNTLYSLHPSIVVLVQQGGHKYDYYTAMFDSLDDCLPRDNHERLSIERNHLGKEVKNALVDCFGSDELVMEDYGFCGIKLSSRTVMQAKLLLKMRNPNNNPGFLVADADFNAGFRVSECEDGKAISLVWQDRELITASAWQSV